MSLLYRKSLTTPLFAVRVSVMLIWLLLFLVTVMVVVVVVVVVVRLGLFFIIYIERSLAKGQQNVPSIYITMFPFSIVHPFQRLSIN